MAVGMETFQRDWLVLPTPERNLECLSALHVLLIGKPSHDAGVYSAERLEQALAMNEVHSVHTAMHTLVRARSKHERKGWACVCACACMRVCVEGL